MPFTSPSWRSLNPLKGSLNHPKKGHFESPGPHLLFFSSFSHHLIGWFRGGGLETCWESCASDYTLGGAHQPFPPHKCLSRQHLPARNMVQLVQPPFGGSTLEKLGCRGDRLLPKEKRHSRISRIESQPKKNGGWGHDPFLRTNTNIYMGLFVQTARGMAFVFKDQVGNWPEIVYTLEVQRLVFECYFRKDYCCRKGLLSKIPNDNAFNCRLDFQGMSQSQVSL